MEPFIVNRDITNIKDLFCRENVIKTLVSCAKRKENVGIIGARRFGKTCILKSMESYINNHPEINAIPIYFDVKAQTTIHKNTNEVYYTLAALLAKKMCETKIIPEGEFKISRRCSLDISTDSTDMKIQMSAWNSEYQQNALFVLADNVSKSGKYVLLLLDEIDAFLIDALNTASDFGRIRGAALEESNKLKIWIAGTAPWKAITTNVGSPELNCGIKQFILSSSNKIEFDRMWEFECSLMEDEILKDKLTSICDLVYEKTGGIPYYAKFIGSCFINGTIDSLPDYTILRDYISEIYDSRFMTDQERSVLQLLSNGPKSFDSVPDDVNILLSKGLVHHQNNSYSITFGYMSDYVKAIASNTIFQDYSNIEQTERDIIVDEIIRLRHHICDMCQGNAPFIPLSKDPIEFENLKKECVDDSTLTAFATSLCKLYYEGSDKGKRLPAGFFEREFCNMIRALRNKCDHTSNIYEKKQMSDKQLYHLINHGICPYEQQHFANVQMNVLKMFREELCLIQNCITKQSKDIEDCITKQSKKLEDGKLYEGIVVSISNPCGTFLNIKCKQCPFPLQIESKLNEVYEDEIVMFTAKKKTNKKDSNKAFWVAENVRLKE